jgi:predicted DNA-binding transcriptional regulator AlpA
VNADLRAVRVPQTERYLSRKELAELMGISVASVDRMKDAGMPYETWSLRTVRFLPSRALAWAREQERRAAA